MTIAMVTIAMDTPMATQKAMLTESIVIVTGQRKLVLMSSVNVQISLVWEVCGVGRHTVGKKNMYSEEDARKAGKRIGGFRQGPESID